VDTKKYNSLIRDKKKLHRRGHSVGVCHERVVADDVEFGENESFGVEIVEVKFSEIPAHLIGDAEQSGVNKLFFHKGIFLMSRMPICVKSSRNLRNPST